MFYLRKTLVVIEVSRKQDYIFGTKKLRENALRSKEIAYITDEAFFVRAYPA